MRKRRWLLVVLLFLFGLALASTALADEGQDEEEEEVVVTATRLPVLISQAPGTVQVISDEELAQTPGLQDLAEILTLWLGVPVNSSGFGGGVTTLGLRGAGSEQVLVMLNGIPLVNPQNGVASLSFLAVGMIDRVEIVQGPLSALYGEDALGGVINIITKRGQPGGSLSLSAPSLAGANLQLGYELEQASLGLGLSDWTGERPNSDYAGAWQFGSFRPRLGNWDLELGAYRYGDEKGLPGPTYAPSPTANGEDGQEVYYLTARRQRTDGESTFRFYRIDLHSRYWDGPSVGDHDAYRLGLEGQRSWVLGQDFSLMAVGKFEECGVDSNLAGEHTGITTNLALQGAWTPQDSLQIYAADLWSSHSLYGASHSPRLGLVYPVGRGLILKAMYSSAFRAPTFNELYWPADAWSQGNPDLVPERASTWEAGLEYQRLDRLVAKVSLYHTQAENLIEWLPVDDGDGDPWDDPWMPLNHGLVRLDGLDVSVLWRAAPRWIVQGQIHLLQAREFDPLAGDYSLSLESKVPASAVLAVLYGGESFQAGLFARYYQEHGDVPTAAVCDLAATWSLQAGSRLRLSVANLWDRDYFFIAGYPMPGRTFSLEWSTGF